MDKKSLLEWQVDAGADEAVDDRPRNYFAIKIPSPLVGEGASPASAGRAGGGIIMKQTDRVMHTPLPNPPPQGGRENSSSVASATARVLADQCNTLAELEAAVRAFDGCDLKKTASKTVFAEGNPEKVQVMVIGEAPGAQEDIQGVPFCGPSGKLLDNIFKSIGLTRDNGTYIANTVFWRPPGNRQPSPEETAICMPFVEKHIALVNPKLLVLAGGVATTTLLQMDQSISRLRGKVYEYSNPYLPKPLPVILTYHPSYLLRSPSQKRLAWQDMLMVKKFLENNN